MKKELTVTNQITEGIIWKQLLFFFFPIVFGTFFQQLYNTVDTMIVGHYVGKNALACVGGSAAQITSLIDELCRLPGIGSKLKDVDIDDNARKKPEAIIRSMTMKERRNPGILNASRRKRIAAGAGVTVQDVNALIRQFEQTRNMMKQMLGNKRSMMRTMRNMKF